MRRVIGLVKGLVRSDQRGVISVVLAIALPILIGMGALVVDLGRSWQVRRQLQNCADAAALAGAADLGDSMQAVSTALAYLSLQGPSACVTPGSPAPVITLFDRNLDGVDDALEVIAFQQISFSFASVLGVNDGEIAARAVAGKITPSANLKMEPFGLQVDPGQLCGQAEIAAYTINGQPIQYGQQYIIKYASHGPESGSPGNYQALALAGTGSSLYRENIRTGYSGWVTSCDTVPTEPGNMQGPTAQGMNDRLAADVYHSDPWEQVILSDPPIGHIRWTDCPRVLNIAIIPPIGDGRSDVQILTFAWFFVEAFEDSGPAKGWITGRFIDVEDKYAPPEEWLGNSPWIPQSTQPFGVKLLE